MSKDALPTSQGGGYVLVAAKVAVSSLLLYFLLKSVDWAAIQRTLLSMDFFYLAIATGLVLIQTVLLSWRWKRIVERLGACLTTRHAIVWTSVGIFFNQALPSSIGGDAVRIVLLRGCTANTGLAVSSVVIERVTGLLVLSLMVSACAFALCLGGVRAGLLLPLIWIGPTLAVALASTALLASVAAPLAPAALSRRLQPLRRDLRKLRASRTAVLELLLLGAAASGSGLLAAWVLGSGLGIDAGPLVYGAFVGGAVLLTILPISLGGWGLREASVLALFATLDMPREPVLVMSLLWGLLPVVVSAPLVVFWWVSRRSGVARSLRHRS